MSNKNEKQNYITIKLQYKNAISLYNFKQSLEGLYNQYNKHLSHSNISIKEETLLIKKITEGSIIIELISSVVPLINDVNNIVTFYVSIKKALDWLSTKKGKKPQFTTDELTNYQNIVSTVKSPDQSINFSINGDNNTVVIYDKTRTDIIKNSINEELATLAFADKSDPAEDLSIKGNTILQFTHIQKDKKNNKFTKGIIADIDKKSYPLMFEKGLKQTMVLGVENPLRYKYLVDIKIIYANNKIDAYIVLELKDTYFLEDEEIEKPDLFSKND